MRSSAELDRIPRARLALAVLLVVPLLLTLAAPAAASIHWTRTSPSGAIGKANLDGTGVDQTFVSGLNSPFGLAVDGSFVYWVSNTGNRIGRARLDGTDVTPSFVTLESGALAQGIEVDDSHVYWANRGVFGSGTTIGRANLDGTGVDHGFIGELDGPHDVAVDDEFIYWSQGGTDSIARAKLDGSEVDKAFITGASTPFGIAIDATRIYWANWSSGTIGRANLDGSAKTQAFVPATESSVPTGIAVDDTHLFWVDQGAPGISRASKDDASGLNRTFVTGVGSNLNGVVVQHATSTALDCAPAPVTEPGPATCTATVADAESSTGSPGGTVGFGSDADGQFGPPTSCELAPAGAGRSTCSVAYAPGGAGVHELTASYAGSAGHLPSSGDEALTVFPSAPAPSTTAVDCSPTAILPSTPTTCTATVTHTGSPAAPPTGSVDLAADGAGGFDPDAGCTLEPTGTSSAACSATYTPSETGDQTITASYAGDGFRAASSGQASIAVALAPTATALDCAPASVGVSTATTCSATVTAGTSAPAAPTGTVALAADGDGDFDPDASCTPAAAGSDSATCSLTYTPSEVGAQTVTASYAGDGFHAPSSGEASISVAYAGTATVLACEPASVQARAPASCTATVSDAGAAPAPPAGTVELEADGPGAFDPGPSCTLAPTGGGTAACSLTYTPSQAGERSLTATYAGTSLHAGSSGQAQLAVTHAPTATAVSCALASLRVSAVTTCGVTVTDTGSAPTVPTGSVELAAAAAGTFGPAASCTLAATAASAAGCSLTYTPSVAGDRALTAAYAGSDVHGPSAGGATLTVAAPPPIVDPLPQAPSNRFSLGKPRLHPRKGTATLRVELPGPGSLVLSGTGVRRVARRALGPGAVRLAIAPQRKPRATLRRRGSLRVRIVVRYAPTGGEPSTRSKRVRLVRR